MTTERLTACTITFFYLSVIGGLQRESQQRLKQWTGVIR